jgi:predicted aspartyl protease
MGVAFASGVTILGRLTMTQPCLDRRSAALMALAGALWPIAARADLVGAARVPHPPAAPPAPAADVGVFSDLYRRMTAPVRIDGHGPFAFVVDTGANRSVISAELAQRLSLPRGPDQSLNDAAGVQLEPTVSAELTVGARPGGRRVLSVLPASTIGGEGMLGLDGLGDQRLTLDFHGGLLRIEGSRAALSDPLDVVVQARRRSGQLTLVDADIDGAPVTAFLDSGSQATIGNPALHALARARDPRGAWTTATIVSAAGQAIPAEIVSLRDLRVGGLRVSHLPVAFADLHTFRLWGLDARPAILLGVDLLSRFDSVALDFARGEVRFRLPARA